MGTDCDAGLQSGEGYVTGFRTLIGARDAAPGIRFAVQWPDP